MQPPQSSLSHNWSALDKGTFTQWFSDYGSNSNPSDALFTLITFLLTSQEFSVVYIINILFKLKKKKIICLYFLFVFLFHKDLSSTWKPEMCLSILVEPVFLVWVQSFLNQLLLLSFWLGFRFLWCYQQNKLVRGFY